MKVLVDTSVWSLALRRGSSAQSEKVKELCELIKEVRVDIIGPIRQEILSGIKSAKQFEKLKSYLAEFPDLPLETADYETAAGFYNTNRKKGIQGSNTDFLICAVACNRDMEIFTTDRDFRRFEKNIPVKLHAPRAF